MKPSTDWSFDGIDSCKENIYTMYNESNQPGKKSYKGLVEVEIMSSDGSSIRKFYLTWKFAVRAKVLAKWEWTLILTISPMSVLLIILASIIYHNKSKKKKFECFVIEKENDIFISYSSKDEDFAEKHPVELKLLNEEGGQKVTWWRKFFLTSSGLSVVTSRK